MSTFSSLGISSWLIKTLDSIGIKKASLIQKEAIPAILGTGSDGTRRDLFACSRTGSGKTLAYVLPILELVAREPKPYFALILAPTRELAYQINEMIKLLTGTGSVFMIKTLLVIGGGSYGDGEMEGESQGLWLGKPNIVVATPGRLLDQLENRNLLQVFGQMRCLTFDILVMDEADQLISTSFCDQMKRLLSWFEGNDRKQKTVFAASRRQTLVLSATLTPALEQLKKVVASKDPAHQPLLVNLLPTLDTEKQELSTNPDLDQRYLLCPESVKTAYLVECLLDLEFKQLVIFCETKKEAKVIHKMLLTLGFNGPEFAFNPVLLNADLKQSRRFAALDKFKSLKSRILVTTDLSNRGLDLPQVDLIINYNCPKSAVAYVHRVGRTCRKPDFYAQEKPVAMAAEPSKNTETELSGDEGTSEAANITDKVRGSVSSKKASKCTGKSITIVTQYDIKLLKNIETFIGIKLKKESGVNEGKNGVEAILKQVALAIKEAEISLEHEEHDVNTVKREKRQNNLPPTVRSKKAKHKSV